MAGRRIKRTAIVVLFVAASAIGLLQVRHSLQVARYPGGRAGVCRVSTNERVVALSFDDGPDPEYTRVILHLLADVDARATFFVLGELASRFPALVRAELAAPMELGNHTWSHPKLPGISMAEMEAQLMRTQLAVPFPPPMRLFRPPYGEMTPEQFARVQALGYTPVHWSAAIDHYVGGMGLSAREAASQFLRDLTPGDIILAHDAGLLPKDGEGARKEATAALKLVLAGLESRDWDLVTVGELLRLGDPVAAKPRPWFWQSGYQCPDT